MGGMFCGPKQIGWECDIFREDLPVILDESCEVGAAAPSYDEAVNMLKIREKAAPPKAEHKACSSKKQKGLKTDMESDEDLDALLDEFKNEPEAEKLVEPVAKAENSSRQTSTKEALKEV